MHTLPSKQPCVDDLAVVCVDDVYTKIYLSQMQPCTIILRLEVFWFSSYLGELCIKWHPMWWGNKVKELLRDAIVVGKTWRVMRERCFDIGSVAHCVYDTATNARPCPKLTGLAIGLLGQEKQQHSVHDQAEDAFACLEIFLKHGHLFEEAPPPWKVPSMNHIRDSASQWKLSMVQKITILSAEPSSMRTKLLTFMASWQWW